MSCWYLDVHAPKHAASLIHVEKPRGTSVGRQRRCVLVVQISYAGSETSAPIPAHTCTPATTVRLAQNQSHDLDYPDFYDSLYRLVTSDMMYAKYRARFFRMVDLCLSSSHVPAYVVAAFLKRFAR